MKHNDPVPTLPGPISTLPGATWRPLTLEDVDAFVRLHEEARVADAGEEVTTEEVARHELTDPNCPAATNTLALALPDGALAASITVLQRVQGVDSRRVFLWGVTLGVDAENPTVALGVYERVGFRPIRRSVRMQRTYEG